LATLAASRNTTTVDALSFALFDLNVVLATSRSTTGAEASLSFALPATKASVDATGCCVTLLEFRFIG
jgi:hypothetical protein